MSATDTVYEGRRLVVAIYLVIVVLAGAMGFLIGVIAPQDLDPRLFGVLALPRGPLGMAVYGAVTVAAVLGVVLAAVKLVSDRYAE